MHEKPLATPRGSAADNEIKDLQCQTGVTAHTEPKGQFGEVSTRVLAALRREFGQFVYHNLDGSFTIERACVGPVATLRLTNIARQQ